MMKKILIFFFWAIGIMANAQIRIGIINADTTTRPPVKLSALAFKDNNLYVIKHTGNAVRLLQNDSRFWVGNNNRVGINTTLPTQALEVVGNAKISGNLEINGVPDVRASINSKQRQIKGVGFVVANDTTISYDNNTYLTTTSASSIYAPIVRPVFVTDATTPRLKITGAGDIGKGSDLVMGGNNNDLTMHGTGKVILGTGGFQRLVVTNAGNVGVGTVAPTAKFEVSGLAGFRYNDGKQADGKYLRSNSTGIAAWDSVKVTEVFGLNTALDTKQAKLSGTGFVKSTAGVISYDTTTYLSTADAATLGYLPIDNPTATGTLTAPRISNTLGANLATSSAGRVGIGTTSPATKFHLYSTNNAVSQIESGGFLGFAYTRYKTLDFSGTSSIIYDNGVNITGSGTFDLYDRSNSHRVDTYVPNGSRTLYTRDSARISILQNGNVGIGIVNPNNKLEIKSNVAGASGLRFTNLTSSTASVATTNKVLSVNASGDVVPVIVSGAENLIDFSVNADPNLAGTTFSPNQPQDLDVLYISTIDNSSWKWNGLVYNAITTVSTAWIQGGNSLTTVKSIGTKSNTDLPFITNNTEKMRILASNGNVGIGSTLPVGKLIVNDVSYIASLPASSTHLMNNSTYRPQSRMQVSAGINNNALSNYFTTAAVATQAHNYSTGALLPYVLQPAGGNVGIGTPTPQNNLDIVGGMNLRNVAGAGGSNYGMEFNTNANSPRIDWVVNGNYTGSFASDADNFFRLQNSRVGLGGFRFLTNPGSGGTERLTILNNGNVGIGVINPSTRLQVDGTVRVNTAQQALIMNSATGVYSTYQYNGAAVGDIGTGNQVFTGGGNSDLGITTRTGDLVFGTSIAERMRINAAGNVGIGTINPISTLHLSKSVTVANPLLTLETTTGVNGRPYMDFKANGTALGYIGWGSSTSPNLFSIQNYTNASLQLGTNSSARLTIFGNGNIGIGTTADVGYKTDISGTLRTTNDAYFATTSGNVGVGTASPTSKFHINSSSTVDLYSRYTAANSVAGGFMMGIGLLNQSVLLNRENTDMEFYTNNSIKAIIKANGSVGIGVTNPTATLDINGFMKLKSYTTAEINAIVSPQAGFVAYNSTLGTLCFYDGTSWKRVSHSAM